MDMDFELPLDEYEARGLNLVLWGEPRKVDTTAEAAPDYFGINAGVMLLRNNDWSRAFFARILAAGEDIEGSTKVQGATLKGMCDRAYDCVVSDQSTIVYLLYTQPELWRAQTLLEKRYALNGCAGGACESWGCSRAGIASPLLLGADALARARRHWQEYYGRLVPGSLQLSSSIWGSDRVPFVMHFAGCQLCSGKTDAHYANWDECRDAMAQALNHVEDWGLSKLGLRHKSLTDQTVIAATGPPSYPDPPPPPPAADDDSGDEGDDVVPASSSADAAALAALKELKPPSDGP